MRTADQGTDGAISAWLQNHAVEVTDCADAYEACVTALTHDAAAPDLAIIGADWLAPDELEIVTYVREAWPNVTSVVHGHTQATAGFHESSLTVVCRSADALRRILAEPPAALLARTQAARDLDTQPDDGWRPQPKSPPAGARPTTIPGTRSCTLTQTQDAELLAAELAPRVRGPGAGSPVDQSPAAPHGILTREELEALLRDDET